jgi:hypothetical protein
MKSIPMGYIEHRNEAKLSRLAAKDLAPRRAVQRLAGCKGLFFRQQAMNWGV